MKQKTSKAIAKRFKITKSGKLLRRHQNSRHLRNSKSKKQKRKYKTTVEISAVFAKKFRKLINT